MSDPQSGTPITDALSLDPSIERRDVPSRVWREMAKIERALAAAQARITALTEERDEAIKVRNEAIVENNTQRYRAEQAESRLRLKAQPADAKPEQSSCAVVFGPEQQDYPGGPIYRVGTSTGVTLPTQPAAPQEKPEQPVAWRREWDGDDSDWGCYIYAEEEPEANDHPGWWMPLYAHPTPASGEQKHTGNESGANADAS